MRDLDEAFAEFQIVGSRRSATSGSELSQCGQLHGRGMESGAEVDSPIGYVVEFKNGRIIRVDDFFDPKEAFEAVGFSE